MKKRTLLALALSLILCFSLLAAGCGESNKDSSKTKDVSVEEVKEESATASVSEASKAESEETEAVSEPEETKEESKEEPAETKEPADDVTAESLLNGYYENIKEDQPMSFEMLMKADMNLAAMGQETSLYMNIDIQYKTDGENAYMIGSMENEQDGEKMAEEMEQYYMKDGDGFTVYSYQKDSDSWEKYPSDAPSFSQKLIPTVDPEGFELEEDGNQYKVFGKIDINKLIEESGEAYDSLFSNFMGNTGAALTGEVGTEFYFSKDTKELTAVNLDMAEVLEETFNTLFSELMKSLASSEDESSEEIDLSSLFNIKINGFDMNFTDIVFDDSIEIVLPDAAKDAVETGSEEEDFLDTDEQELSIPVADSFEFKDEYKVINYDGHEYNIDTIKLGTFLKDNNLTLPEDYKDKMVETDGYDFATIYLGDTFDSVTFFLRNETDKEMLNEECPVYQVDISIKETPVSFSIGGISNGSTLDDIIAVLGNPTEGYESEYLCSYTWQDDNYNALIFDVDPETKVLTSASVSVF